MDISVYCYNNSFECSFIGWNDIRTDIIKSTELYFNEKCKLIKYKESDIYVSKLTELFGYLKHNNDKYTDKYPISKLIMLFLQDELYKDALNKFDLDGLFFICFTGDTTGYYKSEESKEICKLLDNIKVFLQEIHSNYTYEAIYCSNKMPNECLYEVFKEGVWKQELVVISYKNNLIL